MLRHDPPRLPQGFRCAAVHCGLKDAGEDLALFASSVPAAAAAVFTRNHFPGAPILVGRERVRSGRLQAVVVNSKVSNVGTGPEGVAAARAMARAAARELDIDEALVLMSSTGVIGVPLPIERIESGLRGMAALLQPDPLVGARGMMTTDSHPKAISVEIERPDGDPAVLTVVAKGSGMIAPNMATMLAYAFTDARLDAPTLDAVLRRVVARTFNMLSVDTDTSTSDTCALLANGLAGPVDPLHFEAALTEACEAMTEMLARDGEGATRLLRVVVRGAATDAEARVVARALVESPLIKTMVHGGDPNVGRILMAVGKCVDVAVDPERVHATLGGLPVVAGGRRAEFDDGTVRATLLLDTVELSVDLGVGSGEARAWGCDLSRGYVDENAAYYSS
ncbi:MAG: bifunctional glutamate N-acetyltransferase/amino-acid acetyltransferase ArgJ [Gemmatimonadetes bacterium]|nr:bifunctional glutamate N-acetyltransferase/amino-acid acetyltransferase ArgJ [Gemmatimonadota bacterium]